MSNTKLRETLLALMGTSPAVVVVDEIVDVVLEEVRREVIEIMNNDENARSLVCMDALDRAINKVRFNSDK